MRFVVATRLAAVWLVLPFFYFMSQLAADTGANISVVKVVGEVSQGTWEQLHWGLRSASDYGRTLIGCLLIGTGVVLVALYHGYTVRPESGSVGVGKATARSMVVSLVLMHVIFLVFSQIFYGGDLHVPIGG
jgi:phospholipid/cholesterol/gamma-HCH transport system permease protein